MDVMVGKRGIGDASRASGPSSRLEGAVTVNSDGDGCQEASRGGRPGPAQCGSSPLDLQVPD